MYETIIQKGYTNKEGNFVAFKNPQIKVNGNTFVEDDGINRTFHEMTVYINTDIKPVPWAGKFKQFSFLGKIEGDEAMDGEYQQSYSFMLSEKSMEQFQKVKAETGDQVKLWGKPTKSKAGLYNKLYVENITKGIVNAMEIVQTKLGEFEPSEEELSFKEKWIFNIEKGVITPELNNLEKFKAIAEKDGIKVDRIEQLWNHK